MSACPTGYGRKNKFKTPTSMLVDMKERAVNIEKAKKMSPEELEGKYTIGVLHTVEKTEHITNYDAVTGISK
jgi:2-oxoglutarate ferredoxin oxidoreductase subunit beta